MDVNTFEAALAKGVVDHEGLQASFELKEEVKRVGEALRFANSRLCELEKLNTAIFSAIARLVDLARNQNKAETFGEEGSRLGS